MSVYRPSFRDPKTGKLKQSKIYWYNFNFAGRHVQESSKSGRKTIAVEAEKKRRLELEKGFNEIEDKRGERIRSIADLIVEFNASYKLRNPRSATFADYTLRHVKRLLGKLMAVDMSVAAVKDYQNTRLTEKAAPKTINEEVGLLLRILGERGEFLRGKLRRERSLKLKSSGAEVARAFTPAEKEKLLAAAKLRRSPSIYPALMLALHSGMRDAEIRGLTWGRVDLQRAIVTVGASKSEAGEGRTIPLNSAVLGALVEHSKWFLKKFKTNNPALYVFPFGKPQPTDATRPMVSMKAAWRKVRTAAGVTGRWHDNRHTFITDLAESGQASDETIQDLAGHVSKRMLKHYSHIRMEAKRRAVDALVKKAPDAAPLAISNDLTKDSTKVEIIH